VPSAVARGPLVWNATGAIFSKPCSDTNFSRAASAQGQYGQGMPEKSSATTTRDAPHVAATHAATAAASKNLLIRRLLQ